MDCICVGSFCSLDSSLLSSFICLLIYVFLYSALHVIMPVVLCIILATACCGKPGLRTGDFSTIEEIIQGQLIGDRRKRAIPSIIAAILSRASLVNIAANYRLFTRKGGYKQALSDFDELRPPNFRNIGPNNTPKRIKVGDRTVILRQDNRRGILDIYEQKNLPDGSAGIGQLDRVIYHD